MIKCLNKLLMGGIRVALLSLVLGYILFSSIGNPTTQTPSLEPYLTTFRERCEEYKIDCSRMLSVDIQVKPLPLMYRIYGQTIGLCWQSSNVVILSEEFWNREDTTNAEREMLVFHELAHCILMKDHIQGADHIMNPAILSYYTYLTYYQKLNDSLFDCAKNCPAVKFKGERYK